MRYKLLLPLVVTGAAILSLAGCSSSTKQPLLPTHPTILDNASPRTDVKVNEAKASFDNPGKDENLQQPLKNTLDLAQKQLELGTISPQQAEKQFKKVRDDDRVNLETRKLAHKLIMDSKQAEMDRHGALSENKIEKIKQLFYNEGISESEKERRINIETVQELTFKSKVTSDMIKEEEGFNKRLKLQSQS